MSRARIRVPVTTRAMVRTMAAPIGAVLLLSLLVACGGGSDGGSINPNDHKTLFLSSATYDGNLGGLAGADAKCQALADSAQLQGTYRAWLSSSTIDAVSRMTPSNKRYLLPDGTKVADNLEDLADGSLDHALNVHETGVAAAGNPEVWTGWDYYHCADWSSNSSSTYGFVGIASAANGTWHYRYAQFCSRTNVRLYCIEQ